MVTDEKNHLLNFELNKKDSKIEIHGNKEGFLFLVRLLENMLDNNISHYHLMTESWGGTGLSEEVIGEDNELVNHVKIFLWNR